MTVLVNSGYMQLLTLIMHAPYDNAEFGYITTAMQW